MNTSVSRSARDAGGVFMELAVILPFAVMLALGAFKLDTTFENSQNLSLVSREAANGAFQDCGVFTDPTRLATCLTSVVDTLQANADPVLPGLTVTVSVYRCIPHECTGTACVGVIGSVGTCDCQCKGPVQMVGQSSAGTVLSQQTEYDVVSVESSFPEIMEKYGQVVIGEAYYTEPHMGRRSLYETTTF